MFSVLDDQCYFFGIDKLTHFNHPMGALIASVLQQITVSPEALNSFRHYPLFQTLHNNLRQEMAKTIQKFNRDFEPFFKSSNKFSLNNLKQVVIQQCDFNPSAVTVNALYHFLGYAPDPLATLNLTLIFHSDGRCVCGVMYFPPKTELRNFYWSYTDTRIAIEILYDTIPIKYPYEIEILLQDLLFDKNQFLIRALQPAVDGFTLDLRHEKLCLRPSIDKLFEGLQNYLKDKFTYLLSASSSYNSLK